MKSILSNQFLWGVFPYICLTLFLVVPIIRMIYRPFGFSTRATSLFNRDVLGAASLALHWGLVLLLLGHIAGFIGGLLGSEGWIDFFYWTALVGGFSALTGSIVALVRRCAAPEARAISQWDDYLVHLFLIVIMGLALYQVVVDRIFGVAYTASAWLATVIRFNPQPELLASASLVSRWHVFLALTFLGIFPFTKLVHLWTFPVNYFVRPYQAMRTNRYSHQRRWEFALRTDKSFLLYALAGLMLFLGASSLLLGRVRISGKGGANATAALAAQTSSGRLSGIPLYVSQCARCHGVEGRGDGPGADSPTFATAPRDLTLGRFAFISTVNSAASDGDLARTIRTGLASAGMPAFPDLDERQVASLVAVTRSYGPKDAPAAGATITVPARPAQASVQQGKELFLQACASCHGLQGKGDGPIFTMAQTTPGYTAPKDFAGRTARPRDLTKLSGCKAGASADQLYLRIAAGIPPVMPGFHSVYKPDQLWSLVLFVQDLTSPQLAGVFESKP